MASGTSDEIPKQAQQRVKHDATKTSEKKVSKGTGKESSNDKEIQAKSKTFTQTFTLPKPIPITRARPSVKILIMNCSGTTNPKYYKEGSGKKRDQAIPHVIAKHVPHVLLFQEMKSADKIKKLSLPDFYSYKHHDESSIMFDKENIRMDDVSDVNLNGLQRYAHKYLQTEYTTNLISRMKLMICTIPALSQKFICVSWHGPHTSLTQDNSQSKDGTLTGDKGKDNGQSKSGPLDGKKRQGIFRYLMEFLQLVKEIYNIPLIIGGDFNIQMSKIKEFVKDPFQICRFKQSGRRDTDLIDYFIFSKEIQLHDMTRVNLETDTYVENPHEVLDHDPFVAELTMTLKEKKRRSSI